MVQYHSLPKNHPCDENPSLKKAEDYLKNDQPKKAIRMLATIEKDTLTSKDCLIRYHQLLAEAYFLEKQIIMSVREHIKQQAHLTHPLEKSSNQQLLWKRLNTLKSAEIDAFLLEDPHQNTLTGWLKLALIAKQSGKTAKALIDDLIDWQKNYPEHPGNRLIAKEKIKKTLPFFHHHPKQIALLLPLSGSLKGPGSAVRDGFLSAAATQNVTVQTYDTATLGAIAAYHEAVKKNSDSIVGPLIKQDAEQIAKLVHPVPTLILNDVALPLRENGWSLSLKPTLEAETMANYAIQKKRKQALLILPNNPWGTLIGRVFSNTFNTHQGIIIDTVRYDETTDFKTALYHFLHVNETPLVQAKRDKTQPPPNLQDLRRTDFDVIFLLAYPEKARQIVPLLRYYFVHNIPILSTSTAYSGTPNTLHDRDLNGLIFCDIPTVFKHPMPAKNWPAQYNSYTRLYALGYDSFFALQHLTNFSLFPEITLDAMENALYQKNFHTLNYPLIIATFHQGLPKTITF